MTLPGGFRWDVPDLDRFIDELVATLLRERTVKIQTFLGMLVEEGLDPESVLEELAYEISERGLKLRINVDDGIVELVEE